MESRESRGKCIGLNVLTQTFLVWFLFSHSGTQIFRQMIFHSDKILLIIHVCKHKFLHFHTPLEGFKRCVGMVKEGFSRLIMLMGESTSTYIHFLQYSLIAIAMTGLLRCYQILNTWTFCISILGNLVYNLTFSFTNAVYMV